MLNPAAVLLCGCGRFFVTLKELGNPPIIMPYMQNDAQQRANVNKLIVKGAREHNLKNIDVELPRDKLIVVSGLSGSGKSSLAFDTIFA